MATLPIVLTELLPFLPAFSHVLQRGVKTKIPSDPPKKERSREVRFQHLLFPRVNGNNPLVLAGGDCRDGTTAPGAHCLQRACSLSGLSNTYPYRKENKRSIAEDQGGRIKPHALRASRAGVAGELPRQETPSEPCSWPESRETKRLEKAQLPSCKPRPGSSAPLAEGYETLPQLPGEAGELQTQHIQTSESLRCLCPRWSSPAGAVSCPAPFNSLQHRGLVAQGEAAG